MENPDATGNGFLLIAVPWSPSGPHAVTGSGGTLTYPRRFGTATGYLSETEVSLAYRKRFSGYDQEFEELADVEAELVSLLTPHAQEEVWVVVSLVPDIPGEYRIDGSTYRAFRAELADEVPIVAGRNSGRGWRSHDVRTGRLISHGGSYTDKPRTPACILHSTGAGSVAVTVSSREIPADSTQQMIDEDAVNIILGGLRFLGRHARDRAATGGMATVMATVISMAGDLRLARLGSFGLESLGSAVLESRPSSTAIASIDDIAEDGPLLVVATHALTAPLFQAFGLPEPRQTTRNGQLRRPGWSTELWRVDYEVWAESAGVAILDSVE